MLVGDGTSKNPSKPSGLEDERTTPRVVETASPRAGARTSSLKTKSSARRMLPL